MRDLAQGELSLEEISKVYRFTPESIKKFAATNKDVINVIKEESGEKYAGLWIARREYRIAEYQDMAEKLKHMFDATGFEGAVVREWRTVIKAAAEELGQLMQRAPGARDEGSENVDYNIGGVELENLS